MKGQKTFTIHGTDYVKPNQAEVFEFGPKRVGGITPGRKSCIKKKVDGNEDAMAVINVNQQVDLLLLADSHYGAMPANYAVDHFARIFGEMQGSNPRRLFFSHLTLDREIREKREPRGGLGEGASTTLISVALKGDTVAYCSTGDSRFYRLRDGHMQEMIEIHDGLFLGDNYKPIRRFMRGLMKEGIVDEITYDDNDKMSDILFQLTKIHKQVKAGRADLPSIEEITDGIGRTAGIPFPISAEELAKEWHPLNLEMGRLLPTWGSFTVKPGDILLMATDGIEPEVSNCSPEEIQDVLEDASVPLIEQAAAILEKCLGKKGGNDNLTFMIQRI
ncbi:MAG: PP2C family serine/threonine-protein phosphatase [Acidobacteriota bacterium]|nr:PP2C family serine/threonine-protein phosphatase [Acidobacteriota bacterium]